MKITSQPNRSIVKQLTDILNQSLPQTKITGLTKDLGVIKVDAKGKGKSVIFNWRKSSFKLTENLKVTELDLTNSYVTNEETSAVEQMINGTINKTTIREAIANLAKNIIEAPVKEDVVPV